MITEVENSMKVLKNEGKEISTEVQYTGKYWEIKKRKDKIHE